MHELEVAGSPSEMGQAHGEHLRDAIRELVAIRRQLLLADASIGADGLERTCERLLRAAAEHAPVFLEELEGIAAGASMSMADTLLVGAMTDVADCAGARGVFSECTTVAASRESRARGSLVFGTWDSHANAQSSLVLIRRRPRGEAKVLGLTTAGAPIQQGVNDRGLAFAINNLRPDSALPGLVYTASLQAIATLGSVSDVATWLRRRPHASGHYYPCADACGDAIGIETANVDVVEVPAANGAVLHTNHYVAPELSGVPYASTVSRYATGVDFLNCWDGSRAAIWSFLSSHPGNGHVCRHGSDGTRSCAAFILDPASGTLEYTPGPACLETPKIASIA